MTVVLININQDPVPVALITTKFTWLWQDIPNLLPLSFEWQKGLASSLLGLRGLT